MPLTKHLLEPLMAHLVKNLPVMWEIWVQSLNQGYPLEKEMVAHSSILAWENSIDREAWRVTVHWVTKSQAQLSNQHFHKNFSSVQFSRSVMSDSLLPHESQHTRPPCPSPTPGVHPTHVHQVGDAVQPSHPPSSPSPPAPNPSQHQGLFQ